MDLDFLTHAPFWVALGQIIIIDILLGGDNAVVIALACRKLPPEQRKKGIIDRKSTRLNSSHLVISYAVFCLKKKKIRFRLIAGIDYISSYDVRCTCDNTVRC